MKLNILGTEYDYRITTDKEDIALFNRHGYCDGCAKIIAVKNDYNEKAPNSVKDFDVLKKETKRHECIHAFFYESGLSDYAGDEQIVEWIAVQFPKLLKVFREIDAVD